MGCEQSRGTDMKQLFKGCLKVPAGCLVCLPHR